jgi:hypothetical protein
VREKRASFEHIKLETTIEHINSEIQMANGRRARDQGKLRTTVISTWAIFEQRKTIFPL